MELMSYGITADGRLSSPKILIGMTFCFVVRVLAVRCEAYGARIRTIHWVLARLSAVMDDFELFARQFRHLISALLERYGWTPEEDEQRYQEGAAIRDWYTDPANGNEVCRLIQELRSIGEMTESEARVRNMDAALESGFIVASKFGETTH